MVGDGGVQFGDFHQGLDEKFSHQRRRDFAVFGFAQGGDEGGILGRRGQHGLAAFRRGADHGGSADVDVFDQVGFACAGGRDLGEGIKVCDDELDRGDAAPLQFGGVAGIFGVGQQRGVEVGVEGLDAAVEDFGVAGDLREVGDGERRFAPGPGRCRRWRKFGRRPGPVPGRVRGVRFCPRR